MTVRTRIAGAVVAVAVVFAAWSGWSLWQAKTDPTVHFGQTRAVVLVSARQSIATLTTVRRNDPAADLDRWLACTTGALRQELVRVRATTVSQLRKAKADAVGSVTAAALEKLDESAGIATLLATVTLRITPIAGTPVTERHRYRAVLTRNGDGWKVSSLGPLGVAA